MKKGTVFVPVVLVATLVVGGRLPTQAEPVKPELRTLLQELAVQPPKKALLAPAFSLPDLDGAQVELARLEGRVVMLYFWTTYCPYCARELPSLNRLYEEYRARGLEVLLVNMGEDEEHVRSTAKTRGYRMPILLDSWGEVSRVYAVTGTPTVYLITRRGLIVGRAIGMRDWAGPQGRAVLEALLDEQRQP